MGNIILLDDLTINKIAAGEVIERPASVVKELIENSIDAGAKNINVEIKNGGISYIRITDDGKGIMPDDMEIAIERHATSKIRVAEDIEKVTSMGFRGEALASIAAISKMSIKSKTMDNDVGYEVVVQGGTVISKQEVGCQNGTTITVEDLFYNTPVRYKFLRKDFTEGGYIEDCITRIALIHPEIAIKLVSSGKIIIQTSGNNDIKSVIYGIYGKDIAENILNVNYEYEDIKVTGVIGKPQIARANRANQLFFVNKRYVKDKILSAGADQAFKGMLPIGKFGFLILNIELNPQKVDVNVHPAKLEVRFEEEQKVFKTIYHAIKDVLSKDSHLQNIERVEPELNLKANEEAIANDAKSLFERLLSRKEDKKEDKPNIIEQVYKNREQINENTKQIDETEETEETQENTTQEGRIQLNPAITENVLKNLAREEEERLANNLMKRPEINLKEKELIDEQENNKTLTEDTIDVSIQKQEEKTYLDEQETLVITEEMKQEIAKNAQVDEDTQVIQISTEQDVKQENEKEDMLKENMQTEPEKPFNEMFASVFGKAPVLESQEIEEEHEKYKVPEPEIEAVTSENISIFENIEKHSLPNYKIVGIAFTSYAIIEIKQELYIVNEQIANEKIIYEKIKENYHKEDGKDSQLMLLPDIINLNNKQMDIARENMEIFKKAGFMVEEFGENTIKLSGVPEICMELDTQELFIEALDEINKVARTDKEAIEDKFITSIASKIALKEKLPQTEEEIDDLMEELLGIPGAFETQNGKPIAVKMTKADIERKFARR